MWYNMTRICSNLATLVIHVLIHTVINYNKDSDVIEYYSHSNYVIYSESINVG